MAARADRKPSHPVLRFLGDSGSRETNRLSEHGCSVKIEPRRGQVVVVHSTGLEG
jgi:hypothetical protein